MVRNPYPRRPLLASVVLLGAGLVAGPAVHPADPFRVEPLGDGVHLYRPVDAAPERANSLVVEREDGLLVVDAQPTPRAARELLARIETDLQRPVRYLVLSHPHAESAGGASAFPDSTLVLASRSFRDALADANHDFGAEQRARSADPGSYVAPPLPSISLVIHGKIELDDERNPVHLVPLGPTHSIGDLQTYLPRRGTMHVGGIVFMDRNPYLAGGNIDRWIHTLNGMLRQRLELAVGVRGPVADAESLRRQRDSLAWILGHAQHALIGRPPIDEARRRILALPGLGERFDLEASPSFVEILVDALLGGYR